MATFIAQTEVRSSIHDDVELQNMVHDASYGVGGAGSKENIRDENVLPPDTAVDVRQMWNEPRINMWRVFATFYSFFIFGMNDGAYGALVPYLEEYYDLSYTVVSLVFLSPFAGYTLASILNNTLHVRFGQRGVAIVGPGLHLLTFIVFSIHPPYPVLVIFFLVVGFGNGILDAAWCAWLGNMASANQVTGILQAAYALGAMVSPLVATALITEAGTGWYSFYYLMIGGSFIELVTSTWAFWAQTGKIYQLENPRDPSSSTGRTREALKNKLTWIFALYVFANVGAEVSLGGWIVTFMTRVRKASKLQSAASSTGFWAGMTVGRLFLPILTNRIGEFNAVIFYLFLNAGLELVFWLVPSFPVSVVAVSLLGCFLGPLFPTAVVLLTKLLPRDLHVSSIGFATAFGGSGGAIFPFIVGAIAQSKGVKTLQPVILALLVVMALLWLCLPLAGRRKGEDEDEETQVGEDVRTHRR